MILDFLNFLFLIFFDIKNIYIILYFAFIIIFHIFLRAGSLLKLVKLIR